MTNEEFIKELETADTWIHKIKRYDRNSSSDLRDIALKINEIVDVVNLMIEELNLEKDTIMRAYRKALLEEIENGTE